MRIPLTLGVFLTALLTLPYAYAIYTPATSKNEVRQEAFSYGQAKEIGLFGSTSTTWYRAAEGDPENKPNEFDASGATLLCLSPSSEHGRCATSASQGSSGGESNIPLDFKEELSGTVFTLNLRAVKAQSFSLPTCQAQYPDLLMDIASRGLNRDHCDKHTRDAALFKVYLPASEINKLPFGGKWRASFRATLTTRRGEQFLHRSDITIALDDAGRSDIYFPEFGSNAPRIRIPFIKTPSHSGVLLSAQRLVDICLYDGFNLSSNGFRVSFSGSDGSAFNLLRDNGKGQPSDTISLDLQYAHTANNWENVTPNKFFTVNTSGDYSTINLPGISAPVICKNTTLKIAIAPFLQAQKASGIYRGNITILMMRQ